MKKIYVLAVVLFVVFMFVGCGKEDKNRDEYLKYEHQVSIPVEQSPTSEPTATPTPTLEISTEDIMNSFHREENVIEVQIQISCAKAYDKPYKGDVLGYLVGEDFITPDFYWADHNGRIGFNVSCVRGLYQADDKGIIHPIEYYDEDGVIWVDDGDALFSLVPHPEEYDMTDWGS